MILRYQSGVEIKKGDRVLYAGKPGEIELVAVEPGDQETGWYVTEYGSGVMIREPKLFGRVFISADQLQDAEDLEFVSRSTNQNAPT
ncbi:MAG TPA: hypothetical protein VJR04_12860 [Terriglobales bacterium]|nr:hypothetical protein [Terriglobales bacterium]